MQSIRGRLPLHQVLINLPPRRRVTIGHRQQIVDLYHRNQVQQLQIVVHYPRHREGRYLHIRGPTTEERQDEGCHRRLLQHPHHHHLLENLTADHRLPLPQVTNLAALPLRHPEGWEADHYHLHQEQVINPHHHQAEGGVSRLPHRLVETYHLHLVREDKGDNHHRHHQVVILIPLSLLEPEVLWGEEAQGVDNPHPRLHQGNINSR